MTRFKNIVVVFLLFIFGFIQAQNNTVLITGKIIEQTSGKPIENAAIKVSNTSYGAVTDTKGEFILSLPKKTIYKLIISHISYQSFIKEVKNVNSDTLGVIISLQQRSNLLDSVLVYATHKPETLVGKPNYSIFDFDFYEDKLIVLAAERSLTNAKIQLSNYEGKIISSYNLPKEAGEAKYFFHDYEGYTDVICENAVFRLDVLGDQLLPLLFKPDDFKKFVEPIEDTANTFIYTRAYWDKYPLFNYHYLKNNDTIDRLLRTITNADLLKLYNLEFYYLTPKQQVEARQMAAYYKVDKHIIAALMSGFTQSLFYEPLYAPIFILKDTLCIFDHHSDRLYHYNKQNKIIDSVNISYHHPKNWREWKRQLFVDEVTNNVYAFFSKDGRHYLKQIDFQTGKEIKTYSLKHHSAEKIKIKDGYVYYVYRPFDSTQERFLYREKIE